ncbi:MAG: YbhB/YbcL family Raf kinase inhibitor-like protein [Bacteroidia bacterium]
MVSNTTLKVKSTAFEHNAPIPVKYTCEGENINPALLISDLPGETKSMALIMDDPDAPKGTFDHWIMWNIAPQDKIEENSAPGVQGKNGRGENKYTGPCPPSGNHHYHFKVYALDRELEIPAGTNKSGLLTAMAGHILGIGELIGVYRKTHSE